MIASKSGLLRQYSADELVLQRTWKSTHKGPVRLLAFDPTSTFLASGGTDGAVKVWDVIRKFCTHNLQVSVKLRVSSFNIFFRIIQG